jgi:prophage maintenance system killer protein
MSKTLTPETVATPVASGAQERLEELRTLEYEDFKHALIEIHNTHPDIKREVSFVNYQNMNTGGEKFPRPEDKDELLAYALEQAQAQDDVHVAAFMLGAAIGAVHPFHDGNGRTARTIYSYFAKGLDIHDEELVRVRTERNDETVDLTMSSQDAITDLYVYQDSGVTKIAEWVNFWRSGEVSRMFDEQELHGLSAEDRERLDWALGDRISDDSEKRNGTATDAIIFGFSKLKDELGLDIPTIINGYDDTVILVADALASLDGNAKRLLTAYIQDYDTLKAKAVIDSIGKHGDVIIENEGREVSVRKFLYSQTRNYVEAPA